MILTLSTEDMPFSPNFLLLHLLSPDVADLDVLALSRLDVADLESPHVVDCKSEIHGNSSV